MKIGIDARFYGEHNRGIGRYVKNLVDCLAKIDFKNDYVIFLLPENYNLFNTNNPRFKKILVKAKWYGLREHWHLPIKIWQNKIDLMHFPHFNVPIFYFGKYIVTIHDLTMEKYPSEKNTTLPIWLYKIKLALYKMLLTRVIKRAQTIITPSEYVKNDLVNYYKSVAQKIKVIYEGVGISVQNNPNQAEQITKYKPYLLYVGAAYPHKNLEFLIKAFKKFNLNNKYNLVLAGKNDFFYQRLQLEHSGSQIIFTGEVNDSTLLSLYQNAELFIFPSLSEGFGLPALEAQSNNLPVLSSNLSCLPEILRDSVTYFNPLDEQDLIQKLELLTNNESLRHQLILQGQLNCQKFDFLKMALQTQKLY